MRNVILLDDIFYLCIIKVQRKVKKARVEIKKKTKEPRRIKRVFYYSWKIFVVWACLCHQKKWAFHFESRKRKIKENRKYAKHISLSHIFLYLFFKKPRQFFCFLSNFILIDFPSSKTLYLFLLSLTISKIPNWFSMEYADWLYIIDSHGIRV